VRAAPVPEPPRSWRAIPAAARWGAALTALLVLAVVVFLMVFQWNWLRGPIGSYASAKLDRTVMIHGDLKVHLLTWTPTARAGAVTVAQPSWAGRGQMTTLPRLTLSIDLRQLLHGKVLLPVVDAEGPDLDLRRDGAGRNNWTFGPPTTKPQPLKLPPIRNFIINHGRLTFDDAVRRLHFTGSISSNEQVMGQGQGRFNLTGLGVLNRTPFSAVVTGGPLINVDPDRPYHFTSDIRAGATHVVADGAIFRPFDLGGFQADLRLNGPDLADLYYLTGVTLPNSPPYSLTGDLRRNGSQFDLTRIAGRVGSSDLAGVMKVDESSGRKNVAANLASRRLKLADLTAVVGGAPKSVLKGTKVSPLQQRQAAKLSAEHRIFPDAKLSVSRLRAMDGTLRYRAETVDAGPLPIRQVRLSASLDHGLLKIDPMTFTLPQGVLDGRVRIDARGARPAEVVDVALSHARIEQLTPRRQGVIPLEGNLDARARLSTVGDSVRSAAATANGKVAVVIPQGQMRRAVAELMGINAARGLFMLLAKDNSPTPVRCGVAVFDSRGGVMTARRIVLDTGVVQVQGRGQVDLRTERVNVVLNGKSKKFRLFRIDAPITVTGPLDSPKVGVQFGKAATQVLGGALLGALVNPFAAILPFISWGTTKDADCHALLAEASR
jgi:uncharacterized protein involved in outer membrane biogenesis